MPSGLRQAASRDCYMSDARMASIEEIDRMGMRAFPAFVQEEEDGCVYRAAGGLNYRNSSVTVLNASRQNPDALIQAVTAFSAAHAIRPVLRLLDEPRELTAALAARGWSPFRDCLVMTRSTPRAVDTKRLVATLPDDVTPLAMDEWLDLQLRHKSLSDEEARLFRQVFENVPADATPARFGDSASALLYPEGRWLGLMNFLVAPDARGRGLGRKFIERLNTLPHHMWLQVFAGNEAAVSLYRATGFTTRYTYAYWAEAEPVGRD